MGQALAPGAFWLTLCTICTVTKISEFWDVDMDKWLADMKAFPTERDYWW